MSLKRFPFDRLTINKASIISSLHYNVGCPPKVRWCIGISIEPLDLGDDAAYPELETTVDSGVSLDQLELSIQNWRQLAQTFEFSESQNGSFYVTSAHNPVDAVRLEIRSAGGMEFDITATARFQFEFEQSGYEDDLIQLAFRATYEGFRFSVPTWNDPKSVDLPIEYGIPSMNAEWSQYDMLSFVGRYVDLSQYNPPNIEDNKYLRLTPRIIA